MLSIYKYSSSQQFLRDAWEEKRERNPKFSIRAWAQSLGLDGHAYLQRILSGKATTSKKYVPLLIKSLKLSAKEGMFLDTLIDLERSKSLEEKEMYSLRLEELAPKKQVCVYEVEAFKYLKDPLHVVLLEMIELKDFKYDTKWIQNRLHQKKTLLEIEKAISRLISLGLLIEEGNTIVKTNSHLSNIVDVASKGTQEYHKNVSLLAAEMGIKQPVQNREFNGYALNLDSDDLPLAKEAIRSFIKDFMHRFENKPKCGVNTYQLNLQLFELTKQEKENEN